MKYHQAPDASAPASFAAFRIVPHDGFDGSPRPRNGQRRLGQDRDRHDEHGVGEDQREDARENVLSQDPGRRRAERLRPLDELSFLHREHLSTDDPGRSCPCRQADDEDQDCVTASGKCVRIEESDEYDCEREERDDEEPVVEDRQYAVGKAAEVAREDPERPADDGGDERRGEAHEHRDPRAEDHLREHVPPVVVGSEPVGRVRRHHDVVRERRRRSRVLRHDPAVR